MDSFKKRKVDDNGTILMMDERITMEDARRIIERFSHDQILDLLQNAILRHPDVLEAVRLIADSDPSQRKLFVRGLGWETSTEKLRELFATYGELEEAVVILDKVTGKSKGYGFVIFRHIDGAILALKEPSKKIDGRVTVTQLASAGNSVSGGVHTHPNAADVAARKIYVANVPIDMPSDKLLAHFAQYGEIEEGPLGFDKQTGKSKGFALFVYKTAEGAQASLLEPVKIVDGRQLNCKLANDGKKGKPGGIGGGFPHLGHDGGHGRPGGYSGDRMGMGQPGSYGVPGMGSYGGYSGGMPPLTHHSSLGGAGMPGATSGSYSGSGGYGGSNGSGMTTAYSGYGAPGSSAYGGYGVGTGGVSGPPSTGGVGSGSSYYRMPPTSVGMPSGFPETGPYVTPPATGSFSSQHQATSPAAAPRLPPPGGMYPSYPPYY